MRWHGTQEPLTVRRFVWSAMAVVLWAALAIWHAYGQEATINSPVSRNSVAKVKIRTFACDAVAVTCALSVRYQDSSNNDIAQSDITALGFVQQISVPSSAGAPCTNGTTVGGLATAMNNTRATETGTAPRIQQFRILGYFSDQGCFSQAVTLVP